ncbi:MAG: hypothetical protein JST26_11735 [Bacteroidetes bacterium]|nr:hypothetical protein [Bacteroidota bacterium]
MMGRTYQGNGYRYGFNGKENDNEVVGTGEGTQDYGMRIYNPSLGKFLSVDPLTKSYPMLTPYQFASNTPIMAVDLDGGEARVIIYGYMEVNGKLSYGVKFDGQVDVETFNVVHHAMGIPIYEPLKDNGTIVFMETTEHKEVVNSKYGIQKMSAGPVYKWYYMGKKADGKTDARKGEFPIETMSLNFSGLAEAAILRLLQIHYSNVNLATKNRNIRINNILNSANNATKGLAYENIGQYSADELLEAGKKFVGENYTTVYRQDGSIEELVSENKLKRFRPGAFKKNVGKVQANFETRPDDKTKWGNSNKGTTNAHADVIQ